MIDHELRTVNTSMTATIILVMLASLGLAVLSTRLPTVAWERLFMAALNSQACTESDPGACMLGP